ncbi:MAG: hypothetical protein HXX12_14155 [Geothrix sp.]|uniref:hypothetical protein n=1 Tax=Geothrix sp. TaxID=1962974 RepID=UPI0017F4931E|nr:hypothetical protein [Geothrix sp.]NWJ42102.1 hypothetical protein [Geothrix sp.]WIL19930.1 MAG: hypothetical protein QOZ81_002469 [Geothrix sp.]
MRFQDFLRRTTVGLLFLLSANPVFSKEAKRPTPQMVPRFIDVELPGNGVIKIISTDINKNLVVYKEKDNGNVTLKRLYRVSVDGEILKKSSLFSGEFTSFNNKTSFFIWGAEFGSLEKYAHIWNSVTGEDIQIVQEDNPIKGGVFGNGDGFWIQYYTREHEIDAIKIVVYGLNGKMSACKVFLKAGLFEYKKAALSFSVRIQKPEFPY